MTWTLRYRCPKCGAEPGKRCRALMSGRTTDTHEARWDVAYPESARRRPTTHPDHNESTEANG